MRRELGDLWPSPAGSRGETMPAEVIQMTKSTINKTWIGGLVVFAAGIVAALVGVFLMLGYGGTFTQVAGTDPTKYDFTPTLNGFFWMTVSVIVVGGILGLAFGLVGFAVMVAYVIAAPDGSPYRKPQVPAPAPTTLAPTA
jgi:hypothetical protein